MYIYIYEEKLEKQNNPKFDDCIMKIDDKEHV